MKNYVQKGDILNWAVPTNFGAAIASGQAVLLNNVLVVTQGAATLAEVQAGVSLAVCTEGVFALPKESGTTFGFGEVVYWDNTAKVITSTDTDNTPVGYCVQPEADPSDPTVNVKLAFQLALPAA